MWVVITHDFTDDMGAFLGWFIDGVPGVIHRIDNAALNRLHTVSGIRDGTVLNDVLGINAKTIAH